MENERHIAVFMDYDNLAVDPQLVSDFLQEKGRVVLRRAFGDAMRDARIRQGMVESGTVFIDRPRFGLPDHQGNDICLTIEVMEVLATRPNITTVVLITSDSDYTPLLVKIREYGKEAFIIGRRGTSGSLVRLADRFIVYEELARQERLPAESPVESARFLLQRAEKAIVEKGSSLHIQNIEQVMLRLDPSFDYKALGYATFGSFMKSIKGPDERGEENGPSAETVSWDGSWENAIHILRKALDILAEERKEPYIALLSTTMKRVAPGFDHQRLSTKKFSEFLQGVMERASDFEMINDEFDFKRETIWGRVLRHNNLRPMPEYREGILKAFLDYYHENQDSVNLSLKDAAINLAKSISIAKRPVNEIMMAIKFSGLLVPISGEGYVTFGIPFRITDEAGLSEAVAKVYLRRMLRARPARSSDFPLISTMLYGEGTRVALLQKLLAALIQEQEVEFVNNQYVSTNKN